MLLVRLFPGGCAAPWACRRRAGRQAAARRPGTPRRGRPGKLGRARAVTDRDCRRRWRAARTPSGHRTAGVLPTAIVGTEFARGHQQGEGQQGRAATRDERAPLPWRAAIAGPQVRAPLRWRSGVGQQHPEQFPRPAVRPPPARSPRPPPGRCPAVAARVASTASVCGQASGESARNTLPCARAARRVRVIASAAAVASSEAGRAPATASPGEVPRPWSGSSAALPAGPGRSPAGMACRPVYQPGFSRTLRRDDGPASTVP